MLGVCFGFRIGMGFAQGELRLAGFAKRWFMLV